MDDPRWEPGMPTLDRQAVAPPSSSMPPGATPPRSVPEVEPTPLQKQYIPLSAVGLVCGAIAISALELGAHIADPVVKIPVIVGAPLLLVANADAIIRIWRSARAWLPVARGRGLFRLAWLVVAIIGWLVIGVAAWLVATA